MTEKDIRPIPKNILKRIQKLDGKYYPSPDGHVRCYAYQMTAERFSDTMWTMQQILFMSADRRLAIFLTDELAKTGGADVRMTHDQMAKYMGSAREVVSRLLKYFAGEGIVKLYRGGVEVLDKERLNRIARGEA